MSGSVRILFVDTIGKTFVLNCHWYKDTKENVSYLYVFMNQKKGEKGVSIGPSIKYYIPFLLLFYYYNGIIVEISPIFHGIIYSIPNPTQLDHCHNQCGFWEIDKDSLGKISDNIG